MDQFCVKSIVWASARGDIFWPGEVVEVIDVTLSKKIFTIHFLIEDSYEDIKNQNKIFTWNCKMQDKFIQKGRGLRDEHKKVQFNKAVAAADSLVMQQENKETENNLGTKRKSRAGEVSEACSLRKSPRKHLTNGSCTKHLTEYAEHITEEQSSRIKDNGPLLQSNGVRGSYSLIESDRAGTSKDSETVKRGCAASRLKSTKNEVGSSSQVESKTSKSTRTKSQDESKTSTSAEKTGCRRKPSQSGEKRGSLRKSSQGESKMLTSAEKKGGTFKGLSDRCSPVTTAQRKRKLRMEDDEPKRKKVSPKKGKLSDQDGLDHEKGKTGESHDLSSSTVFTNGHKSSVENKKSGVHGKNSVYTSTETADKESTAGISADCSVSSDGSSDDELMTEPFSPSQESNQFSVSDIVWAKYFKEPYWPALIKRVVTGKRKSDKKILVQFLGWHKCLFKIQPKKLVHFACDPSQRAEFLGVKEKLKDKELQDLFEQALIEAEDLLNRKGLGKSLDDEVDEADFEIFEDEDDNQDDGGTGKEMEENLSRQTPSLFECRKSLRAKKQVSKYADILSYIRQAKPVLRQILNGTKSSERHLTYTSGRVSEKDNLKRRAGFGPIADGNLPEKIMDILTKFYEEVKGSQDITYQYVTDVWLPEAIIWSIQQIDHVDRQTAEKMYSEGNKSAVSNAEVAKLTEKLKQRKLCPEDATERLQKAKRAVARYSVSER